MTWFKHVWLALGLVLLAGCVGSNQSTVATAGLGASGGVPALAGYLASDRMEWRYTQNGNTGVYSKTASSGSAWSETSANGKTFTFNETSRTATYIDLYDSSRDITVRLFGDHAEAKMGTGGFGIIYNGSWVDGGGGGSCTAAQRLLWTYNVNSGSGRFEKQSNGSWKETSVSGVAFTFAEQTVASDYIQLYDASRTLYVRIYSDRLLVSANGSTWSPLYTGAWGNCSGGNGGDSSSTSCRSQWTYIENNTTATVTRTGQTSNWVEQSAYGRSFQFVEQSRSDSSITLFDSSRSLYLRLFASYGQFSTNGSSWNTWQNGSWNTCSGTTPPPTSTLSSPSSISAVPGANQVTLNWGSVSGATSYRIYRNGVQVGSTDTLTYLDSDLTSGTTYAYQLKACDANGCSPLSSVLSVTATSTGSYFIGGSLAGLSGSAGSLGLTLNSGGASLGSVSIGGGSASTGFAFNSKLTSGASYEVAITEQPTDRACVVNNATGVVALSDVSSVSVVCSALPAIRFLDCGRAVLTPAQGKTWTSYNATLSVPYYNGNGAAYGAGTAIASTGVSGLTTTLRAGTLANNGDGVLVYDVTGLPNSAGDAVLATTLNFGGQSCTTDAVLPTVAVSASLDAVASICQGKTISATPCAAADSGGVTIGGQCWSKTDLSPSTASPGKPTSVDTGWQNNHMSGRLFQWSAAMASSTQERAQGACPSGFHVPSDCEALYLEKQLGMSASVLLLQDNNTRIFANSKALDPLTFLLTGVYFNNSYWDEGSFSYFWTSTLDGNLAMYRRVNNAGVMGRAASDRSAAMPVRCLKD